MELDKTSEFVKLLNMLGQLKEIWMQNRYTTEFVKLLICLNCLKRYECEIDIQLNLW